MPVSIRPGHTALTRTSVPASWFAHVCASETTAAFEALLSQMVLAERARHACSPPIRRRLRDQQDRLDADAQRMPATEAVRMIEPPLSDLPARSSRIASEP